MIWLNRRGYCHGTDGSPEECFVNPRVVVNHVVNPLPVLYVQRKKYSKIVVYNKNNDTANNVTGYGPINVKMSEMYKSIKDLQHRS